MTQDSNSVNRRTALKKGGVVTSALAVGLPVVSGTAAANSTPTMNVDVPPRISPRQRGNVTAAIYPPGEDDEDIDDLEELLEEVEKESGGFKLGPHKRDSGDPQPEELQQHADADRWRLVTNGVHGNAIGLFFDASSAQEWFKSDDDAAKLSAVVEVDGGTEIDEIIAWGWQSVTIPS